MPDLNSKTIAAAQLAKTIDHSLIRPELTEMDVFAGCETEHRYSVASVGVKPYHVALAARQLAGADVAFGTVIGFSHGVSPQVQVKAAGGVRTLEALLAVIDAGATRIGATAATAMLEEFEERKQSSLEVEK